MKTPDTDYVDFGFLRCAGEDSDIEDIMKKDIFDYVRELKIKGIIRHIGFRRTRRLFRHMTSNAAAK